MEKLKILILDDVVDDAELVVIELRKQDFQFDWHHEYSEKGFRKALESQTWDLIISDYMMQGFTGLDAIEIFNSFQLDIPFIIISGTVGEEIAVETMRQGAHDYIMKDNLARLGEAIRRELRDAEVRVSHKTIKKDLHFREIQLNSIFSASPVGIGIVKNRIIEFANKRFAELIGYNTDEIVGKDSRFFFASDEDYRKAGVIPYQQLKESGIGSLETRLRRKDGHVLNVSLQLSFLDENDPEGGHTFTVEDITRRVKDEKLKYITYKISELANASADLQTMLLDIRDLLSSVVDTTNFYIALYNKEEDVLNLPFFSDEKDEFTSVPAGHTLTKHVIDQNRSLLLKNTEIEDLVAKGVIKRYASPSKCWLGVPLRDQDSIFGVIGIQSYNDEDAYNLDDMELVSFISDQIASAIRLKKSQDELIESEKKYRVLADAANEAIFISDKGVCIESNKKASEMFGYSHDELLGMFGTDVIADESKELVKTNMISGYSEPYEALALHKDGSTFPAMFQGQMYEYAGKTTRITTVQDLTNEKKNQKRLVSLLNISELETESDDELLEYTLNEAIKLTDSKIGYIYYYSEESKLFELSSWSKDVMDECAVADAATCYHLEKTGLWGEAVRQRKPIVFNDFIAENPLKKDYPEGHVHLKRFLTIPVIMDGKIVAVAGVGNKDADYDNTDITQLKLLMDTTWKVVERKRYFLEILKEKDKAMEADKLKSAFLANMSHEIRTPMNGILGFSDILTFPQITDIDKNECIEQIRMNGKHLLRIIDDLIDISLIESNRMSLLEEEFDIKEIISNQALQMQKSVMEKKNNVSVILSIPSHDKVMVNSDPDRIKQIISNLLSNAEKFTPSGFIECGYRLIDDDKQVEVFVKDTGIGIHEEKQQIIFERFRQVDDSYNRKYGGTGLGLSIVKSILEKMGIDIELDSKEGEGSMFSFVIPLLKTTKTEGPELERLPIETEPDYALFEGKKILIVEDSATNLLYIKKTLSNKGLDLIWAGDGEQAVKQFHKNPDLDLILMDINLPVMNGLEATKKIRKFNQEIKIIAQTAFVSAKDIKMCKDAGCDSYIAKPFNQKILLSSILDIFK